MSGQIAYVAVSAAKNEDLSSVSVYENHVRAAMEFLIATEKEPENLNYRAIELGKTLREERRLDGVSHFDGLSYRVLELVVC